MAHKKTIPSFSTPRHQTRQIDGQPVTVRRLPAKPACPVLSRLTTDVGPLLTELLATPERELDPDVEGAIRSLIAEKVSIDAAMEVGLKMIKSIVLSSSFDHLKRIDLDWLVSSILVGHMSVGGIDIDTFEELEDSGITPLVLVQVILFALEVNFLPFSDVRVTIDGPAAPEPIETRTGTSSLRADRNTAGRQDQTSAATI